ncbi:hypothetical protein B0H67DRAFT_555298 [Lasiosphaeris hirsuta]|uniref:DUF4211 domain-containing protein n=1 Tax=Lasiosphaeris hirsuta TaxID=260670 RepID=A0AA40A8U3_9PEZI|nr:hypothetical protein B0H67DRAFT_555298 [Lasiosphaeris hirsuta]
MARLRKPKQQTLEATLGRPRVKTPKATSKKSSPRGAQRNDAPGSVQTVDEPTLPTRTTRSTRSTRSSAGKAPPKPSQMASDSSDDDKPLVTPTSTNRSAHKRVIILDDSDVDEEQVSSPIKKRRLVRRRSAPVRSSDSDGDVIKAPPTIPSSARRGPRRHRTEKEKARELLRRKRAGEAIDKLESTSSSEEDVRPVYDTDSDTDLVALNEFEDDEEGVANSEEATARKPKNTKSPVKARKGELDNTENSDAEALGSDLEDFIDDDGPMGVPEEALLDIPLQFTSHSHKPLKDHFRDVVEWLVQFKVNPGFSEKRHDLYRIAWQKLDDEVSGLAQSKFASSAWKKDFIMALRARPYFNNAELPKGDPNELQHCGACGRSGHPAKWEIMFSGSPYFKKTGVDKFLEPVEVSSEDESQGAADEDEDEDGNIIPAQSKRWFIGSVCNSNAETAHDLIHWKYALLDWVDATLMKEGYMSPEQLAARNAMRPKAKYKLVDEIMEKWAERGTVKALYGDFKDNLEKARNKTTTGRFKGRGR